MKPTLPPQGMSATTVRAVFCFAAVWMLAAPFCRAAEGGFQTIDLTRFYNGSLAAESPLPQGSQTLGGVPFVIGGKIEVTGIEAARHGEFLPSEIVNIAVNAKGPRLHLLHGARHGQKDGTPLANLIVHFKNGETRTNRLAFGVHARNFLEERVGRMAPLGDPHSEVVWHNNPKTTNEPPARFYKPEWKNPLPNEEIVSVDLFSLFTRATPAIFALTVQTDGTMPPLENGNERKIV